MVYYSKDVYNLVGYRKSKTKNKMYDAIIRPKHYIDKYKYIPFGDKRYENYRDMTGLNLYPNLIHNDKESRKRFRARQKRFLKKGYYSPSYFTYYILW